MIRTVLCIVVALGAWLRPLPMWAATPVAAPMSELENQAERLLWALGGRPAWASATNTIVYSDQYRQGDLAAVVAVSTVDYQHPRVRIDTTGPDLQQVRIIDGEGYRNWRLDRQGRSEKIAEDAFGRDLHRYTGHVYRTLHRIAVRDPQLRLAAGRKGSLDVYEGGTRIAWYLLDGRGEPYAMGAHDDNVGVICGPWELQSRGIRYPLWVSRPDGSWRVTLKSLAVNTRMDEQLFALPVGSNR